MIENLLKVTHVLEGLQQAEPLRMLSCGRAAINRDQRLTVRELGADLGVPNTTVSQIVTQDLGMKRVVAEFVSTASAARAEKTLLQ